MITRSKFPKKRNVLLINDIPVKVEIQNGDKFSSQSNLNLLTSLRTGEVYSFRNNEDFKGINSVDIFTTYLDYSYFEEGNFDFCKDFLKRKDLISSENNSFFDKETQKVKFFKLENQKDLYISFRLWNEFQNLLDEIKKVEPKIIIVTGKWSLFLLTACTNFGQNMGNVRDRKPLGGLAKYRASLLKPNDCWGLHPCLVYPMLHTINAIAFPEKVHIIQLDIQKICFICNDIKENDCLDKYLKNKEKTFIYPKNFEEAKIELEKIISALNVKPTLVSIDIETMFKKTIDCIGFALDKNYGFCLPFAKKGEPNLWTKEEEVELMLLVYEILLHENCLHVGQNYSYDCQYFYKLWKIRIVPKHDTMILHHILFNFLPKDLAFMASLYCENYSYWKDESESDELNPETRWIYNAKDVCYTLEILEVLLEILEEEKDGRLKELYKFQIEDLYPELDLTMNIGVKVDRERKEKLFEFFNSILEEVPEKINDFLGFKFNANSHIQKKKLFQDFFQITLLKKKVKNRGFVETCDSKAMLYYIENYPQYAPFLTCLVEFAALGKFTKNFLGMELDDDGRARTQYKLSGTKFGRLSSTKNVFGKCGNLQNLPEKGKVPIKYLFQLLDLNVSKEDLGNLEDYVNLIENDELVLEEI